MNLVKKIRERIESFLRRSYREIPGLTSEQVEYLSNSSGKRIRALLLFAVGKIIGVDEKTLIELGGAVELVHSASLFHDDIIDEAEKRRGMASAHIVFGVDKAIILGDMLYIKAVSIATQLKNMRVIELMAKEVGGMIAGEMDETLNLFRPDLKEDEYFRIINGKTARLFSLSASLPPAIINDEKLEEELREFGEKFGLAFQILDDVADILLDEKRLKKPVLSDLREGKLTLPYIYYLKEGGKFSRDIKEFFVERNKGLDFSSIREDVIKSGATEKALYKMEEILKEARQIIGRYPPSEWRDLILEYSNLRSIYGI